MGQLGLEPFDQRIMSPPLLLKLPQITVADSNHGKPLFVHSNLMPFEVACAPIWSTSGPRILPKFFEIEMQAKVEKCGYF